MHPAAIRQIQMPFGRYACGFLWHIMLDGVPDPLGEGKICGQMPKQNMQLQIAAGQ